MTASAAAEMTGSRVVVPLDGPLSLDALARSINEHHRLAGSYARATLEHVVACGEALMEARTQVPEGQWRAWLRENVTLDTATVAMYVRLATFAGELRSAGVTSVQAAREYVCQGARPHRFDL